MGTTNKHIESITKAVKKYDYAIVKAITADQRPEGLIDDIQDARRYLMLIESWLRELGLVKSGDHRDNQSYSDLDIDHLSQPTPKQRAANLEVHRRQRHREQCNIMFCNDVAHRLKNDREWKEPITTELHDIKTGAKVADKAEMTGTHSHPGPCGGDKCMAHIPDAACDCSRCQAMAKIATPHIDGCQCGNCKEVRKTMDQLKKEAARRELHVEGKPIDKNSAEYAQLEVRRQHHHRKICRGSGCNDPAHYLRTDRKRKEPVMTMIINEINHPAGCDCVTCKGVRDTERLRHPHLKDCGCEYCVMIRWAARTAPKKDEAKHTQLGAHSKNCQCLLCKAVDIKVEDNPHPVACGCDDCILNRQAMAAERGCGPQCGCNDCLADYYLEQKP